MLRSGAVPNRTTIQLTWSGTYVWRGAAFARRFNVVHALWTHYAPFSEEFQRPEEMLFSVLGLGLGSAVLCSVMCA